METIRPKYRLVAIDESHHCSADFLARCGGKLWATYLVNVAEVTYCCELTPSYYLVPIELVPLTMPGDSDEEAHEALCTDLMEALTNTDPIYMHCSAIDRLPASMFVDFGTGARRGGDDATMDEMEEYLRGNCTVPEAVLTAVRVITGYRLETRNALRNR